ncbi:MAG: hypothetical protein IKS02_01280 [Fibrobacter sp.]|nr:hypothetical protein [Fibrobacter sp.]
MPLSSLKNKPLLLALAANAAVLTLSLILGGWKYESLDDFFMHSVLTGAYGGEYDIHLYFVNAIYGVFLWPFYKILPHVGWYPLFEKGIVFLSFSAITYTILRKYGNKLGGAFAFLVLSCVSLEFYLHVEFTKCACAAAAAGILLFAIGNSEKKVSHLVWGCLFMVAGFVFRKEMFLLGLPVLAALLFFNTLQSKSVWKNSLIALAVLAGAIIGLKAFDASLFKNNEYEYYAAYQPVRAYFGDGAFYDSDAFSDELDERGIGSRDLRYLKAWYFYDNNVFSLDSMNALIKIAQRSVYEPNYLKMPFFVARSISDSLMKGSVWCWLLLCLAIIYFCNKKYWWVPWVSLAIIAVCYTYLALVNRVISHVEAGIWGYAVIFALFYAYKSNLAESKQTKGLIKIFMLIGIIGLANNITLFELDKIHRASKAKNIQASDWESFLQYTKNNPGDVFLLPFDRYKELGSFLGKTYKAIEPGSWNNIHSTGYWNIHLPPMNRELQKRGVSNMFKDIKSDNVFVLNDKQSLSFVPFYKEHYHEDLAIDTVKHFGKLFISKYRVKELANEQETP